MDLSYIPHWVQPPEMLTMTTPINATYAYTFGFPRKNVSAVCISQRSIENSKGIWTPESTMTVTPVFLLQLSLASFITSICKFLLKPLCRATFVGQIMGGVIGGPSVLGRNKRFERIMYPLKSLYILETLSSFGCMFFLFLVGVKMDSRMIIRSGKKAWIIGLSTFILPMLLTIYISSHLEDYVNIDQGFKSSLTFIGMLLASSTFHGVACFLEDLKLLNSELGRLAISSSMVSGFLSYTALLLGFAMKQTNSGGGRTEEFFLLFFSAVGQMVFIQFAIRPLFIWMIRQTPEGKPVKELYHCIVLLLVLTCSFVSEVFGQHGFFGPMILGLALPDGSVLAATLMERFEYFVSLIILPLYFLGCGVKTDLTRVNSRTYIAIQFIALLGSSTKFIGTILPSVFLFNMVFRDAITLGLILSTVGILDIQFYSRAIQLGYIDYQCFSVMNISAMLITGCISALVRALYDPSMRYIAYERRTIQHSLLNIEFRILVCIHNEDHVPNIIKLLEVSNPNRESPICVYLLHLVELVGRASPLFVSHENFEKHDLSFYKPTESVINTFKIFERSNKSLVTLQAFTAIAPIATMHNDICTLALDKKSSLVILPFHMLWSSSGILTESSKFRYVNLKVLDNAPCSVGIFIDRESTGAARSVIGSGSLYHVGVFFMGGPDDREALAYAMRMSSHPNVSVKVVRFIAFGKNTDDVTEKEMDNKIISEFKLCNVGSEKTLYKEEIVTDGEGTCSVIHSMENSFDLILVGRRTESPMLDGLSEWNEYPELGFMADLVVMKDFLGKVSVLVVQQHECAQEDKQTEAVLRHQDSFAPLGGSRQRSGRWL